MSDFAKPIKPILVNPKELPEFKKKAGVEVLDSYLEQVEELFLVRNPHYRFAGNYKEDFIHFWSEHLAGGQAEEKGKWFYFPWSNLLVHFLDEDWYQELRTARNKYLITAEEQAKLYDYKIGVAGLSVGSHPALTLAMMGVGKMMKLADPDKISCSNLNRIRYDASKIGVRKCELVAQDVYQINPYAQLYVYSGGITEENIDDFLHGNSKIDVLVEEVDNLEMKIRLRLAAKKYGIPVVMATDNGDNIIIDIERYDLNQELPIFNGLVGDLTLEEFKNFSPSELPQLAAKIVGPHLITPRMRASLLEVGKTLYAWPQLGDAATLCGAVVTYVVKRLALGESIKEGKLEINLDSIFDPNYKSDYVAI